MRPLAPFAHSREGDLHELVGFGASWEPLVWVLLGEIFPSRIRAEALGVAAGAQWIPGGAQST